MQSWGFRDREKMTYTGGAVKSQSTTSHGLNKIYAIDQYPCRFRGFRGVLRSITDLSVGVLRDKQQGFKSFL